MKGKEAIQENLQKVGKFIFQLINELKPKYSANETFQILERIFSEDLRLMEEKVSPKENYEIASDSLQPLDDLEDSFRTKRNVHYKGYIANITETCGPENDLQLITKVQVAPNNIDDSQLLIEALPNLKERTEINKLYTDGGHGSPSGDRLLQSNHIKHIQTVIRGRKQNPDTLFLADFNINMEGDDNQVDITCPQDLSVNVKSSLHKKAYDALFTAETCVSCPLIGECPAHKRVWRIYDPRGNATADLIALADEQITDIFPITLRHPTDHTKYRQLNQQDISEVEDLQVQVLKDGQRLIDLPGLDEIRKQRMSDVNRLDPGVRRIMYPHIYHVSLTDKLWDLKQALIESARSS